MKPARLTPAANREIAEAAEWYEARQAGLSDRFFDEIDNALALIQRHPAAFSLLPDLPLDLCVRRALLDRFPYCLIFLELRSEIRVIAVSHLKRRPDYWLSRLGI
jgi:toxin ParE1/3/4